MTNKTTIISNGNQIQTALTQKVLKNKTKLIICLGRIKLETFACILLDLFSVPFIALMQHLLTFT